MKMAPVQMITWRVYTKAVKVAVSIVAIVRYDLKSAIGPPECLWIWHVIYVVVDRALRCVPQAICTSLAGINEALMT